MCYYKSMEYAVDPNGNNARLYTHLRIQEQRGQLDAEGAEILETLRADYQELEPIEVPPAETPVARTVEVPARDLVVGLVVDDERFPHVVPVGYAKVGRKWVTFRAFHPDAPVYPNPPRRVPVNGTVRVETRGTVTVLVESDYDDDVHFERTVVLPGPVSNDEDAPVIRNTLFKSRVRSWMPSATAELLTSMIASTPSTVYHCLAVASPMSGLL